MSSCLGERKVTLIKEKFYFTTILEPKAQRSQLCFDHNQLLILNQTSAIILELTNIAPVIPSNSIE